MFQGIKEKYLKKGIINSTNNNYFAHNYEPLMRSILSERNIVVILFVLVLITFSLAQEDSKKMEQMYSGSGVGAVSKRLAQVPEAPASRPVTGNTTE